MSLVTERQEDRMRKEKRKIINDHTLEQVVLRYLDELANPAPDYTMRAIYREWMEEFVSRYGDRP